MITISNQILNKLAQNNVKKSLEKQTKLVNFGVNEGDFYLNPEGYTYNKNLYLINNILDKWEKGQTIIYGYLYNDHTVEQLIEIYNKTLATTQQLNDIGLKNIILINEVSEHKIDIVQKINGNFYNRVITEEEDKTNEINFKYNKAQKRLELYA